MKEQTNKPVNMHQRPMSSWSDAAEADPEDPTIMQKSKFTYLTFDTIPLSLVRLVLLWWIWGLLAVRSHSMNLHRKDQNQSEPIRSRHAASPARLWACWGEETPQTSTCQQWRQILRRVTTRYRTERAASRRVSGTTEVFPQRTKAEKSKETFK